MNAPVLTRWVSIVFSSFAILAVVLVTVVLIEMMPIGSIIRFYFMYVFISFVLCFLIKMSKKLAEENYEKHKLGVVERYRMDVLIQTGVVGFLALLPTIWMFSDGKGLLIFLYATFICVPAFGTCFDNYYSEGQQSTQTKKHRYLIPVWLIFYAFLFIVSLYKTGGNLHEDERSLYRLGHGSFLVLSAVSSLEFLMAWFTDTDELLKENQKLVVVNGVIEVEEVVYENEPKIECKVCYLGYSNFQNTPRILKECGHTICENCANQLLNHYNNVYLECPLCKMISVVNGAANLLKKNREALDFVEDLRRQKSLAS